MCTRLCRVLYLTQALLAQIPALLLLFYPLSDMCTQAFNQDKENSVVSNKESGIRCKFIEYGGKITLTP